MRLIRVEIRDYRSVFADDTLTPLILTLGPGMNTLVGPNNCGKSNVLRAIALALDPHYPFDPEIDTPGPRRFAYPIVTLHFEAQGDRPVDEALLRAAEEYETSLGATKTYADQGRVVLRVAYEPSERDTLRRELLMTPDGLTPTLPEQTELLGEALAKLRDAVRFVLISSGESIRSVLDGNFREILHSVVKERLADAFAGADTARTAYVSGLEESLLAPLRERLVEDIGGLFKEIGGATLSPDVPTIETTLSQVRIGLKDLVATPLSEKGTGVRGGVLVAMLSYLATNATRGMIFALEEPEAFLHPAAQEDLRDRLEEIAARDDVSLLVTTHSPHIVTQVNSGRVFGTAKDQAGRTRIAEFVRGDADQGPVIAALHRASTFDQVLKQAETVSDDIKAVVFVEGDGDRLGIEFAAARVGRQDLLEGLAIRAAAGATKTVLPAIIMRDRIAPRPVLVLLDNDGPGIDARDRLTTSAIGFKKHSQVLTYAAVFPDNCHNFPVEAEDLYDESLWEEFVEVHGKDVIKEMVKRPDGPYHYGFDQAGKELVEEFIRARAQPPQLRRWIELILHLRGLAGLDDYELAVDEIIDQAPMQGSDGPEEYGAALIVTSKLDYSRYQRQSVLLLDTATPLSDEITNVGFYSDAQVKPEFPVIVRRYPSIRFAVDTVDQLRATQNVDDGEVAGVIEKSLQIDDDLSGTTRQLLLLSSLESPDTHRLDHPIRNTKEKSGRPLAWTVEPRVIPMAAIVASPTTTTDLDDFEGP